MFLIGLNIELRRMKKNEVLVEFTLGNNKWKTLF